LQKYIIYGYQRLFNQDLEHNKIHNTLILRFRKNPVGIILTKFKGCNFVGF